MKLLYYTSFTSGGLAEYAFHQANALSDQGIDLIFLCPENLVKRKGEKFTRLPILKSDTVVARNKVSKLLKHILLRRFNIKTLAQTAQSQKVDAVLFSAFTEYFSPFWTSLLSGLRKARIPVGSIIHDPIRDAIVGPLWWHKLSVGMAYNFINYPFVHENGNLDTGNRIFDFKPIKIPHGPYACNANSTSTDNMRAKLGIPESAKAFLAFGHIRDSKNLNLAIEALAELPEVHLIIAGRVLSNSQRPVSFYQDLAEKMNVSDRCHWYDKYIPEDEIELFFNSADFVLLTYSSAFRSASGVLNVAVSYRKPCLASSGPSPLKTLVSQYNLGCWVEPDSKQTLLNGFQYLLSHTQSPDWDKYLEENSWKINAEIIVSTLFNKTNK